MLDIVILSVVFWMQQFGYISGPWIMKFVWPSTKFEAFYVLLWMANFEGQRNEQQWEQSHWFKFWVLVHERFPSFSFDWGHLLCYYELAYSFNHFNPWPIMVYSQLLSLLKLGYCSYELPYSSWLHACPMLIPWTCHMGTRHLCAAHVCENKDIDTSWTKQ